jgi:hypothetical protein
MSCGWSKNNAERCISIMKLTTTFAGMVLLICINVSVSAKDDTRFTQTSAEATRLSDTAEGKAYDAEFGKVVSPQISAVVGECTKNLGPRIDFQVVFIFGADGRVQEVLTASDQPGAKCVGEKLRNLQLPPPPRAGWPVKFGVNINPDNGPMLLTSALKLMATGTWEVDATLNRGVKMRIHGLLAGDDFDLTFEPEGRNAVRQIAIKDKIWASFDGGKTWKLQTIPEQATFRRVYNFVHNPIRPDVTLPAMEVAEQETRDGEKWMHVRPKGSAKKQPNAVDYWFAISQDSKRNGVRRYEGPVTEPGHEKEPLHCIATYQPANDKTIQPPAEAPGEQSTVQPALPTTEKSGSVVSLYDGKLKIDVPADFVREPDDPKEPKTVAKFLHEGEGAAWGEVLRGTHGLTPDKLDGYLKMRVAEYSKGFNWLPKDSHLQWLKKEIITVDGRKWADWRYVPMKKGMKNYRNNPVYTRFLTTSYKGQLLEIMFTSNLDTDPKRKEEIDHIMDSVHLEE